MKDYFSISRQQMWVASIVSLCVIIVAACYGWMMWNTSGEGELRGSQGTDILSEEDLSVDGNQAKSEGAGHQTTQTNAAPDKSDDSAETAGNGSEGEGTVILSAGDYLLPVEGEIFRDYSLTELTYFPTLNQYMVHKGIDILAPEGSEVKAASDGLVSKVFYDRMMGKTIWISHEGEIITVYSNLQEQVDVEEGDVITKGQVIGKAGSTSLYELQDEPHVHIEVHINGEQMNPADYFNY